jgi:hypothetical protein
MLGAIWLVLTSTPLRQRLPRWAGKSAKKLTRDGTNKANGLLRVTKKSKWFVARYCAWAGGKKSKWFVARLLLRDKLIYNQIFK